MLELQSVSKVYGAVTAVHEVSLRVEAGELLVLLGGSGSGKTTTLKMVNRLVPPSAGRVLIGGVDAATLPVTALRRRVGYVFQGIGLFPHMTVAENIGITPSLLGWAPERIRAQVQVLLERVELDPATLAGRMPAELSGGQAQRVAVARALAAEPEIVLFDEPFGALDAITRDRLQVTVRALQRRLGFTAIFVTHDVVEAMILGDRVGVMRDGRLIQLGAGRELYLNPVDATVSDLIRGPLGQARRIEALFERAEEAP